VRVVSGFSWVAHSSRLSGDFLILHTPLSLDCNGCGAWRLGSTVSCLSGTEPGGQTGGLPTSLPPITQEPQGPGPVVKQTKCVGSDWCLKGR